MKYEVVIFSLIAVMTITGVLVFFEQPYVEHDLVILDENESPLPEYEGTWLFKEGQQPSRLIP